MQSLELHPQPALWIAIVIIESLALLFYLFSPLAIEEWPYIPGRYKTAGDFQAARIGGMLVSWLLGAPLLVARLLVGVAILRFIGWV